MTALSEKPLVSVLMTAYNRENYIAEAIQSVLSSSYTNFELIIVDDRSSDRTVEIARSFEERDNRIRVYVNDQNLGDYPNRNKAASYAQGKYIKYVDADDYLYDYALDVMVRYTERYPEAGFGLSAWPEDDRPFPVMLTPRETYLESFGRINHFDRAPGSGLIKTEVFREIGGFSGKRMIGDYEFWFRISRKFSMVKINGGLYWNRIHEHQESLSDYARRNYRRLRNEVLYAELNHPECPLSKDEIETILKNLKKKEKIDRILSVFNNLKKVFD